MRVEADSRLIVSELLPVFLALRIARRLDEEMNATYSGVQLLSRIGDPVAEPWPVDVTTTIADDGSGSNVVEAEFGAIDTLGANLLSGTIDVF